MQSPLGQEVQAEQKPIKGYDFTQRQDISRSQIRLMPDVKNEKKDYGDINL
jgi:hypothetical protein